ncbi:MAG: hypothetical protein QOE54_6916 [Streptosporangiaceae bacterium]|jgi:hypothetical protein|nr:hypothetical protein [Streptosporangiaceae bacterium]MDX6434550.1 hypothetical protein [Streptosporangiaceae bacterium]
MVAGALGGVVVAVCAPLQNIVMRGNAELDMHTFAASTISSAVDRAPQCVALVPVRRNGRLGSSAHVPAIGRI